MAIIFDIIFEIVIGIFSILVSSLNKYVFIYWLFYANFLNKIIIELLGHQEFGLYLPNNHKISNTYLAKESLYFFNKRKYLKTYSETWNKETLNYCSSTMTRNLTRRFICTSPNPLGLVDKPKETVPSPKVCIIPHSCSGECIVVLSLEPNLLTFAMKGNSSNMPIKYACTI